MLRRNRKKEGVEFTVTKLHIISNFLVIEFLRDVQNGIGVQKSLQTGKPRHKWEKNLSILEKKTLRESRQRENESESESESENDKIQFYNNPVSTSSPRTYTPSSILPPPQALSPTTPPPQPAASSTPSLQTSTSPPLQGPPVAKRSSISDISAPQMNPLVMRQSISRRRSVEVQPAQPQSQSQHQHQTQPQTHAALPPPPPPPPPAPRTMQSLSQDTQTHAHMTVSNATPHNSLKRNAFQVPDTKEGSNYEEEEAGECE